MLLWLAFKYLISILIKDRTACLSLKLAHSMQTTNFFSNLSSTSTCYRDQNKLFGFFKYLFSWNKFYPNSYHVILILFTRMIYIFYLTINQLKCLYENVSFLKSIKASHRPIRLTISYFPSPSFSSKTKHSV